MVYAQFYFHHCGKQQEACGDRSVIIIDARLSLRAQIDIAYKEMLIRCFNDFEIREAENLNRPYKIIYKRMIKG